jgi:NhaA family Na+:H+ antiporter
MTGRDSSSEERLLPKEPIHRLTEPLSRLMHIEAASGLILLACGVAVLALVGKPAGILLLSWLSLKVDLAQMPEGLGWRSLAGGGFLAGIGFTMALFIASLAFADDALLQSAKVGVLAGSLISAVIGIAILGAPTLRQTRR